MCAFIWFKINLSTLNRFGTNGSEPFKSICACWVKILIGRFDIPRGFKKSSIIFTLYNINQFTVHFKFQPKRKKKPRVLYQPMLRVSVIRLTDSNRMKSKNKSSQMSYIITMFSLSSHSGVYRSWHSKQSILMLKFRISLKKHSRAMFCMIWYALGLWMKLREIIVGSIRKKSIIFWKTIWF